MKKSSHPCSEASTPGKDPVERILALLPGAVLVPNRSLTKIPTRKEWEKLTSECMSDPVHLRSLVGRNIGVLLGSPSGGICTIDLDNDEDVERFLALNPRLLDTTRTKRVRGCNFWIVLDGPYPPSGPLVVVENGLTRSIGEWRADGNQTLIFGSAIDRRKGETQPTAYRFLNEVAPVRMRFEDLVLPNFARKHPPTPPLRLPTASEFCVTTSLNDCVTASLHNNGSSILANVTARNEAQKTLEQKQPQLAKLYSSLVENRFLALPHQRNAFLTQAVPFLYHAVAEELILPLVGHFYDCNRALFEDSRAEHLREAQAMLNGVAKTYDASLSTAEFAIFHALPSQLHRDLFRICRDFASLPDPPAGPFTFYSSFEHMAMRVGNYPTQVQRAMRQLEGQGLLKLIEKGKRREPGVKAVSGTYQWLVPAAHTADPNLQSK